MKKGIKLAEILVTAVCVSAILWVTMSVAEIGIKNKGENPNYSSHNAIIMFYNAATKN